MDKENVQGLILAPYRYRRSRHLLFTLPAEAGNGRGFIRALLPHITHGETDIATSPPWLCNMGLTCEGLGRIGCDPNLTSELDASFLEGPSPQTMGDIQGSSSDRETWWDGQWQTSQIHLTVQIYAREAGDLMAATELILGYAKDSGWIELLPRKTPDPEGSRHLDGAALPRAESDKAPGA